MRVKTGLTSERGWRGLEAELSRVLAERLVTPAFQPLVELVPRDTIRKEQPLEES